jgi:hypothetical protein
MNRGGTGKEKPEGLAPLVRIPSPERAGPGQNLNMKRLFALILSALVVVPLAGIAQTQAPGTAPANPVQATKAPPPKPYPLDVCAVSGEELGSMGEPHVLVLDGREIQLCCKGCVRGLNQDKKQILAKVDAAARKVKPYPLDTCLVSGEKLGSMGEPIALVRKEQEIRLCCKGCLKEFNQNQARLLKQLSSSSK